MLVAKLVAKNTFYSTILAGNILFFPREYKLQNSTVFIPIQLSLEIWVLPIYFEVFCPFPAEITCKTCACFSKVGEASSKRKKAFKTQKKLQRKLKDKKNFAKKKQKGGVKDEPALQLSPVSGKYL